MAEWQTRWLQVPVSFGTWGFKSPFAHRERFSELRLKGRGPNRVRGLCVWERLGTAAHAKPPTVLPHSGASLKAFHRWIHIEWSRQSNLAYFYPGHIATDEVGGAQGCGSTYWRPHLVISRVRVVRAVGSTE
ncbi:NAD(P)-binding Rossmann-fold containing protein [Mycolicibacterium fortuitum subsp. acetamidolyticum]|uniref:NAD(P)-binding Rossmann-fold containing protein n=1 Tax=Mycolicibacterium fortuitum subsp. acetamidolyticum TaxID=144550 RepID=A0A100WY06_MYCFO|nr:NAD(P)-binding Rossmann-fold containing protein [Mycolicibacterium fortuitum subsp. acetamidolyticum]